MGTAASVQPALRKAEAFRREGKLADAERLYDEILHEHPDCTDALNQLAGLAIETGRPEFGARLIERAIALEPNIAAAHCNLGYALSLSKRFEDALASYDRAIALKPDYAEAHFSRGVMLDALGRAQEAVESLDRALDLKRDYVQAHLCRGTALFDLGRLEEAVASFNAAIALNPGIPAAYFNLGNALNALKRPDDALANYEKVIALKPDLAPAHNNRGIVLTEMQRFEDAVESFDKAIALQPNYLDAYNNRAIARNDMGRYAEALADYDEVIARDPDFAAAHYGRAITLNEMKRPADALESYEKAYALAPGSPFLLGKLLHMKMAICDWSGLQPLVDRLLDGIERGESVSPPFQVLPIANSPPLERRAAEIYARDTIGLENALPKIVARPRAGRIRLGYFSADFHDHATAMLTAGLFENHDRTRFELAAFSFGPATGDAMRKRLERVFDRFVDVRDRSDRDIAALSRELGVDIAIDLKGYTGDERHRIFAYRAAPIQVNFLGYPGTMGAGCFDYLIADPTLIPEGDRPYYNEKIAYLPCYQPNDKSRGVSEKVIRRADVGLPEKGFVFCCFNNSYKIAPERFDLWMRILRQTPGSVFWLLEDNREAAANLRKEAVSRRIDAERVIFAPRIPLPEHLARHALADLFLDTLPYNAHTTASDALWMGLPVLTQKGNTFAGRVAASLLNAVGLSELITPTPQAYEALAVEFAAHPEKLAAIKLKLAAQRLTTPLFDIARFARDIEAIYTAMHERCLSGALPDHVEASTSD